jgi:hypothetical protein
MTATRSLIDGSLQVDARALATQEAVAADEHGATVADARRLARKAKLIIINYPSGPGSWQTGCLILRRAAFLTATKHTDQTVRMPCTLYQSDSEVEDLWLSIGHR